MSSKPWYAWYPGDARAHTARLSLAEKGAYRELLDECYIITGALPNDMPVLWRICGAVTDDEKHAVEHVVELFFILKNNKLHNKRVDHEIEKQAAFIAEQSRKGKASARARWGNRSVTDTVTGDVTEGITETQPDCNLPQPTTHYHNPQPLPQPTATEDQNQPRSKTKPQRAKKGNGEAPFILPDWIPAEHWQNWIDARTKKRNAPTEWAKHLAVTKLEWLREQGHQPAGVLAQSAFNGWSGLFPIKDGIS